MIRAGLPVCQVNTSAKQEIVPLAFIPGSKVAKMAKQLAGAGLNKAQPVKWGIRHLEEHLCRVMQRMRLPLEVTDKGLPREVQAAALRAEQVAWTGRFTAKFAAELLEGRHGLHAKAAMAKGTRGVAEFTNVSSVSTALEDDPHNVKHQREAIPVIHHMWATMLRQGHRVTGEEFAWTVLRRCVAYVHENHKTGQQLIDAMDGPPNMAQRKACRSFDRHADLMDSAVRSALLALHLLRMLSTNGKEFFQVPHGVTARNSLDEHLEDVLAPLLAHRTRRYGYAKDPWFVDEQAGCMPSLLTHACVTNSNYRTMYQNMVSQEAWDYHHRLIPLTFESLQRIVATDVRHHSAAVHHGVAALALVDGASMHRVLKEQEEVKQRQEMNEVAAAPDEVEELRKKLKERVAETQMLFNKLMARDDNGIWRLHGEPMPIQKWAREGRNTKALEAQHRTSVTDKVEGAGQRQALHHHMNQDHGVEDAMGIDEASPGDEYSPDLVLVVDSDDDV